MRNKLGSLLIALGVLALLGAVGLFGYNQWDNARAEKAADAVLTQLEETIERPKTILPGETAASSEAAADAPGRYSGSLYNDDLVIAGHNYTRHFSPIKHLAAGTEVLFVDMDGVVWHYAVSASEVLQPTQIEQMTTKTSADSWDLTLFTCTTGGQARYALRCVRTDK